MATCKSCAQPLVLELNPDDFNEATSSSVGGSSTVVPDDLQLPCGCHFHWQCFLDESPKVAISLKCPSCQTPLISMLPGPLATNGTFLPGQNQTSQILVRYENEGGIQENLNILPHVKEEAYLDANPNARPARAFMIMCGEGDISGIVELLQLVQEEYDEMGGSGLSPAELLRYQDPLDGMKSALGLTIERAQPETAWLLLWLASNTPHELFPREAVNAVEQMNLRRPTVSKDMDIRGLCNEQGQDAEDIAKVTGGPLGTLVQVGDIQDWAR